MSKAFKTVSATFLLVCSFSSNAIASRLTDDSESISLSPCVELKAANTAMNATLAAILLDQNQNQSFHVRLKKEQDAWEKFTQAHLDLRYPEDKHSQFGTVLSDCLCLTKLDLTQQRITQLKKLLPPQEEGDVCNASED